MPHPFQTLAEANAEHASILAAHEAAVSAVNTDLANTLASASAAIVERDQLLGQVTAITSERDTAVSNLATANATHSAALTEAQRVSTERVNAEAVRLIASSGHAPVKLTGSDTPTDPPKAEQTPLKGKAKIAAAIRSQISAK